MKETKLVCPKCGSERIVKNGKIHNGNQNHKCRSCGRQFGQNPPNRPVSETWIQGYVNEKFRTFEDNEVECKGLLR